MPKKISDITDECMRNEIEKISLNRALLKYDKIFQRIIHFEVYKKEKILFNFTVFEYYKIYDKKKELLNIFLQININKINSKNIWAIFLLILIIKKQKQH